MGEAAAGSSSFQTVRETTPQLSGYLLKKTKNDKWQKRWFETNGCFLTYYKSRKMVKLLAALNLPQVGEITLSDAEGPESNLFTIELNERLYTLKAKDAVEAANWVDTLKSLQRSSSAEVAGPNHVDREPLNHENPKSDTINSAENTDWKKESTTETCGCGACILQ